MRYTGSFPASSLALPQPQPWTAVLDRAAALVCEAGVKVEPVAVASDCAVLGSDAEMVLRTAMVPVLLVRDLAENA